VNSDDDAASINVSAVAGLATSESGASATFSVVLGSEPTGDVTIPVTSSNPAEGTPNVASPRRSPRRTGTCRRPSR
jgi:hypothetical protein